LLFLSPAQSLGATKKGTLLVKALLNLPIEQNAVPTARLEVKPLFLKTSSRLERKSHGIIANINIIGAIAVGPL
jgi:hypothetical protein